MEIIERTRETSKGTEFRSNHSLVDVDKINEYFVGITQAPPDEDTYFKLLSEQYILDGVTGFEFRMATTEKISKTHSILLNLVLLAMIKLG